MGDPFLQTRDLLRAEARAIGRGQSSASRADRAEAALNELEPELRRLGSAMAQFRGSVEADISRVWADEFAWVDYAIAYLRTVADYIEGDGADTGPAVVRATFATLCSRSSGVGHEVLALLRGGFPRGAHARWRTLYELDVTARVLSVGNRGTASRYLAHVAVVADRDNSGLTIAPDELAKALASIRRRFKVPFKGHYGWASELTQRKLGVSNPQLHHLETLAEIPEFDGLHRLANHHLHAGSVGNNLRGALVPSTPNEPVHYGCDPFDLGMTIAPTIHMLGDIGSTAVFALNNYSHSRRPDLDGLGALGDELCAMAPRFIWPSGGIDAFEPLISRVEAESVDDNKHTDPDLPRHQGS